MADQDGPFLTTAVWYMGEVACRHRDARWNHWAVDPAAPRGSHHHPDNPWSGTIMILQPDRRDGHAALPVSMLRVLIRSGGGKRLRDSLDDFA
jgi:hypothetical protein